MGIVDKIALSIQTLGLPFVYGSEEEVAQVLDNVDSPCAWLVRLISSQEVQRGGVRCERADVLVFFAARGSRTYTSPENEQVIQACKAWADSWVQSLDSAAYLEVGTSIKMQRVYDHAYSDWTGIAVQLQLTDLEGYCWPAPTWENN